MKNLTTEKQIEKLKKKASKINLKIENLKNEQKYEEKKKAFDLIIELGEKHNLFRDVEVTREMSGYNDRVEYKITMIDPTRIIKREC